MKQGIIRHNKTMYGRSGIQLIKLLTQIFKNIFREKWKQQELAKEFQLTKTTNC